MGVWEQIETYIAGQEPAKQAELAALHRLMLSIAPDGQLWFLDGRNDAGKIVTNESIGYGSQTLRTAKGGSREFYRVGVSANASGFSIYLMGLEDRKFLSETYGARIGKAKVTGYCVSFRRLEDIDIAVLEEMLANHMRRRA